jgi:hypothetical protein
MLHYYYTIVASPSMFEEVCLCRQTCLTCPYESIWRRPRYQKAQQPPDSRCFQRKPGTNRISMDSILCFETIVHFHSYDTPIKRHSNL